MNDSNVIILQIFQYRGKRPDLNAVDATSVRNFSSQQKLVLTSLVLVDFISFCSMSIMAPFFPKEVYNSFEHFLVYDISQHLHANIFLFVRRHH